jgi:glycosyltransferase involved in cell wall biosynthesis
MMANLDTSTHEIHVACAVGDATHPTPTYETVRAIPGVRIRPTSLGVEWASGSRWGRARQVLGTLPKVAELVRLARYIRHNDIDLLHTSDRPRDAAAVVLLGRLTRATSIVQSHVGYGDWMSALLKWSLRRTDDRIAISAFVARTLVDSGHAPESTYVVANGIDPGRWTPMVGRDATRRELQIPDDAPVILTVCRLFPSKGPGELIRALLVVQERHSGARLLIVGREMVSGYKAELERLAAELGVAEHVLFLGHYPDVAPLMAAADVFAMPSIGEPFGLVYLEAMAMELPVVALDSGGAPEVIVHGTTGLLSPEGDVESLAANLAALLSDPERRTQMGRAGRRRVEAHFTSKRMAADVAATYRHILDGRNDDREHDQGEERNDLAVNS